MSFYSPIVDHYGDIFPVGPGQLELIKNLSQKEFYILDAACGTGLYSQRLGQEGYKVIGIDLDKEMVKRAKINNASLDNVIIKEGNLLNISTVVMGFSFGLIYCIGNSLVHITDIDGISKVLNEMLKVLIKSGKILLQIVNYDKILNQGIKELPLIEVKDKGIEFKRNYDYLPKEHLIEFTINLKLNKEGKSFTEKNILYPLRSNELVTLVQECGFKNIRVYGDFNLNKFESESSNALILIAEK